MVIQSLESIDKWRAKKNTRMHIYFICWVAFISARDLLNKTISTFLSRPLYRDAISTVHWNCANKISKLGSFFTKLLPFNVFMFVCALCFQSNNNLHTIYEPNLTLTLFCCCFGYLLVIYLILKADPLLCYNYKIIIKLRNYLLLKRYGTKKKFIWKHLRKSKW